MEGEFQPTDTLPKNYYDQLGVTRTATQAEIRQAYRDAMTGKNGGQPLHPDLIPGSNGVATERYHQVDQAYQVLSNADQKKTYDATLTEPPVYTSTSTHPNTETTSPPSYTRTPQYSSSFSSAWAEMFRQGELFETKHHPETTNIIAQTAILEKFSLPDLTPEQFQQLLTLYFILAILSPRYQTSQSFSNRS